MTEREYVTVIRDAAKAHLAALETDSGLSTRRRLDDLLSTISPVTLAAMCEAWLSSQAKSEAHAENCGPLDSEGAGCGRCARCVAEVRAAENEFLRERILELEEALKPFAEIAASYDPDEEDGHQVAWAHDVTIASVRRARAALSKGEENV